MAGELRNFDPNKVTATWAGATIGSIDLTQGLIDGPGAIQEAKDAPRWSRVGDRQGNMVRNKSSKRGGTVTFTYKAEAPIQDDLSKIVLTDGETGTSVGTLVIKDLNGSTLMTYVGAFIEDDPTMAYGDTAGDRAYVFGYAERIPNLGGAEAL